MKSLRGECDAGQGIEPNDGQAKRDDDRDFEEQERERAMARESDAAVDDARRYDRANQNADRVSEVAGVETERGEEIVEEETERERLDDEIQKVVEKDHPAGPGTGGGGRGLGHPGVSAARGWVFARHQRIAERGWHRGEQRPRVRERSRASRGRESGAERAIERHGRRQHDRTERRRSQKPDHVGFEHCQRFYRTDPSATRTIRTAP